MEKIRWALYGNIYTADYEHLSDGGPKCYDDMDPTFRISVALISSVSCIIFMSNVTYIY